MKSSVQSKSSVQRRFGVHAMAIDNKGEIGGTGRTQTCDLAFRKRFVRAAHHTDNNQYVQCGLYLYRSDTPQITHCNDNKAISSKVHLLGEKSQSQETVMTGTNGGAVYGN